MGIKTFNIVSSVSMTLSLMASLLSIVGIAITGFYPGIIVLVLLAFISITSKFYAVKISNKSDNFQGNYFTTFTIINLLMILVVLWMSFVIVHDRVLLDCC
jgi:ABC-type microcin C transport system permease subunit YejE